MLNKDCLLLFMISCYLVPIILVYYNYNSNTSVSNIICNENNKNIILFFMLLMGIGTILYEFERDDNISIILICSLLIGIYGLVCIYDNRANARNTSHYVFAFLVFTTILCFMIRHCHNNCSNLLSASLFLEIAALLFIIINLKKNDTRFFWGEIFYILNFAFFYLYLHFIATSRI